MKTQSKPQVGQKLFLLNVGNNARRVPQVLTPATVTKVGRKYFTVARDAHRGWEIDFHLESWIEKTEYSPGWAIYLSEQEWEDEEEASRLYDEIQRLAFDSFRPVLPLETLRKIRALLP